MGILRTERAMVGRDVEAVYLQTASASTPIASSASASKKFTEILLVKYDQCVGSQYSVNRSFFPNTLKPLGQALACVFLKIIVCKKQTKA